jgi:hypothetical protein
MRTRQELILFVLCIIPQFPSQCALLTIAALRDLANSDIEFFHIVSIELIPTSFKDMLELGNEHDRKFGCVMWRLGGFWESSRQLYRVTGKVSSYGLHELWLLCTSRWEAFLDEIV